jgi:hypothetical protein
MSTIIRAFYLMGKYTIWKIYIMANETNSSSSAAATLAKYATNNLFSPTDAFSKIKKDVSSVADFGKRIVPNVSFGAMPVEPAPVVVNITDISGKKLGKDLRVRIMVPSNYLTRSTSGPNNELGVENLHGIIFPYTPTISVDHKADYASQTPLHSNFPINFYQKSSVGAISISGKFSVENVNDAEVYIATVHLLKALTKMRSGGRTGDHDSGSPPPVCRLFAHGEWMFDNVPVAITSFRIELPDSVDYFTMPDTDRYGMTSVPTVSTIAISCLPMYSRNEMLKFSVTNYLNGTPGSGYL